MRFSTSLLPLVCTALTCTALIGCPKEAPKVAPLALYQVRVRVLGASIRGAEPETLKKKAIQHIKKSNVFTLNKKKKAGAYRLDVDVGLRPDGQKLVVLVAVRAKPYKTAFDDGIVLEANALAKVGDPSDKQRSARVLDSVKQAIDDVLFQGRLSIAPEDKIVKVLKSEKEKQRLAAAIEIVAVRRVKRVVPQLIQLLKNPESEISDRAIGALIAIGDRRAVKPLTRLAKFDDTERLAKVIDGIGSLGGKEAKEFLEFTAVGHEDADIRNLAREALERMTKRGRPRKSGPRSQ